MNEDRKRNNKRPSDTASILSWIITGIMFLTIKPFGIILLISKLAGRDFLARFISNFLDKQENSQKPTVSKSYNNPTVRSSSQMRGYAGAQPAAMQRQEQAAPAEEPVKSGNENKPKKNDRSISRISKGKTLLIVFGWLLAIIGVINVVSGIGSDTLWSLLQSAALALGGGGMLFGAFKMNKKERLYQNCVKIVGDKACFDLNALASSSGIKADVMEKELDEMVDRGYFGDAAYVDKAKGLLIVHPDKAEQQIKNTPAPEPITQQDKYSMLLAELGHVSTRIEDEEMRGKAEQIISLAAAIFAAVREAPEKEEQLGSFLNYYFPTTIKLLDSYGDFEAQGFRGDNLSKTKERIEGAADNIITAYQKQLNNLYFTDTLDVDSDIDVLETMLKRDGLSDSDFQQPGTGL